MPADANVEGARRFLPRSTRRTIIRGVLVASDVSAIAAATSLATVVRFHSVTAIAVFDSPGITSAPYIALSLVLIAISVGCLFATRLYDLDMVLSGSREYSDVARAVSVAVVAFILATYALKLPGGVSRVWMFLSWVFGVVLVTVVRWSAPVSPRRAGATTCCAPRSSWGRTPRRGMSRRGC
jgi:FlaA1/EpsC-like NDP-sugar epimerase